MAGALTFHWVIRDLSQKNDPLFTAFLLHRLKPSPECGQYQRHKNFSWKEVNAKINVVSRIKQQILSSSDGPDFNGVTLQDLPVGY